ncbi:LHFPL tetraspan subfamily member 2a protein-like [Ruditapes philippinarum]|uniref:LHFPL tetraspan subfamily member 2a protein-like n=1 Tax=Ruditapes philippinarum TaxID=129788 RepID=UPI00295B6CC7|nr:LHFPL tetraspan subfamily member 2a protein-like [Ruditapes philippinarum]
MCQVIITCRSIFWTLLTIATTQIMIASVMSPQWMIGFERKTGLLTLKDIDNNTVSDGSKDMFKPTIGIINRCTRLHKFQNILKRENCATFVRDFAMPNSQFPDAWKASFVFFCVGSVLLVYTMGASVMSICVQSMCGKSIFNVSGLIQSIAGLFCVIGLLLYPVGWSSEKVKFYCGEQSAAYNMDMCKLGWSFYLCIFAVIMVFVCSILSVGAERATSSRKVEDEVIEGKALICVMA